MQPCHHKLYHRFALSARTLAHIDGMQHGMNQDLFAAEARFLFAREEVQQRYDSCLSHRGDVDSLLGPQLVLVLTSGSCPCGVFSSVPQQGQQPRLGDPLSSWKNWPRPHRWPPIRPAPAQKLGPTVLCMCFDFLLVPMAAGNTVFHRAEKADS